MPFKPFTKGTGSPKEEADEKKRGIPEGFTLRGKMEPPDDKKKKGMMMAPPQPPVRRK